MPVSRARWKTGSRRTIWRAAWDRQSPTAGSAISSTPHRTARHGRPGHLAGRLRALRHDADRRTGIQAGSGGWTPHAGGDERQRFRRARRTYNSAGNNSWEAFMRLCPIKRDGREQAAVVTSSGIVPVAAINTQLRKSWPDDLHALILQGIDRRILTEAEKTTVKLDPGSVQYGPLFRHPRKILGIGLNYRDHAADLNAPYPTEPASFMKCDNTIIGPGDAIELPPQSERVTAEAEIGVIIGRECHCVSERQGPDYN